MMKINPIKDLHIIFAIAIVQFKSLFRNFKSSGIMFILPIVFIGIFGIAFGGNVADTTFRIGVVETNAGIGEDFVNKFLLDLKTSENSETNLFQITTYPSEEIALKEIENGGIDVYIFFEEIFELGVSGELEIFGRAQNPNVLQVSSILQLLVNTYRDVNYEYSTLSYVNSNVSSLSGFDLLAPGLIIYSLLILIPGIAQDFAKLTEKNYMFRFVTSKANAFHIMSGFTIYQIVLSIVQVMLSILTATLFGYQINGSILLGILVIVPTAFFSVGIGLLIGAFTRTTESATNVGTIFSIILGFFSGAFIYNIGALWKFNIGSLDIEFNQLFTSRWATIALDKVFTNNASFQDIWVELSIIAVSGILVYAIGIALFSTIRHIGKSE